MNTVQGNNEPERGNEWKWENIDQANPGRGGTPLPYYFRKRPEGVPISEVIEAYEEQREPEEVWGKE